MSTVDLCGNHEEGTRNVCIIHITETAPGCCFAHMIACCAIMLSSSSCDVVMSCLRKTAPLWNFIGVLSLAVNTNWTCGWTPCGLTSAEYGTQHR